MDDNKILENPRSVFSDALVELGEENKDVVYISCDTSLGASGGEFNKRFPARHFEFGIAEQNGMGEAAGMAISGKIPFIAAYVPFITMRCYEQIRDDVCKTKLNVNIMGNNCGFSVSALGPTHVILEDVGAISSLPNMTIISPADGLEYRQVVRLAAEYDGPVYIRIHRQKCPRVNDDGHILRIGKGNVLREGKDVSIIACSTMVARSIEASGILEKNGIDAEIINMSTLKPLDKELILKTSSKTKKVVTVEEHSTVNGLGSGVADILVRQNPVKMDMIGVDDLFAKTGTYEEVMDFYGLSPKKIAKRVESFLSDF